MKPITACLLALSTLTLLGQSRSAHAQATFFPNDATINYAIAGEADIGEDDDGNQSDSNNNPYNPTVSLVTGGSISGVTNVWNGSVFNMSGRFSNDNTSRGRIARPSSTRCHAASNRSSASPAAPSLISSGFGMALEVVTQLLD